MTIICSCFSFISGTKSYSVFKLMISREYYNELARIHGLCEKEFNQLKYSATEANFNMRPSPESWSAAECINHLIVTNNGYLPQLEKLIEASVKRDFGLARYKSTFWGSVMVWAITPKVKFKLKAPSVFKPEGSTFGLDLLDRFESQSKRISALFEESSNLNLSSLKISSPASSFIRYNLGETYRIIFNHNLRHYGQAQRAISQAEKSRI